MPQVIITRRAARDLEFCRIFLAEKNPRAAQRAAEMIAQKIMLLEKLPCLDKPVPGYAGRRELIMEFRNTGYVALCEHIGLWRCLIIPAPVARRTVSGSAGQVKPDFIAP